MHWTPVMLPFESLAPKPPIPKNLKPLKSTEIYIPSLVRAFKCSFLQVFITYNNSVPPSASPHPLVSPEIAPYFCKLKLLYICVCMCMFTVHVFAFT